MTQRKCGSCQLCCKLLPTEEIAKPGNTRCPHQRVSHGCGIYEQRPLSCRLWSCGWLTADDTYDQPRPDRSHVIFDPMPDIIRVSADGVAVETLPAAVVWVDPDHRDAYKAEAFRRWVSRRTTPVIVRFSSDEAVVLIPPCFTNGQGIIEHASGLASDMPTTLEEKARLIGATMSETPAPGDYGAVTLTMPDGRQHTVAAGTGLDVLRVPMGPSRR